MKKREVLKRSDLIRILAEKRGLNTRVASKVVENFFDAIKEAIKNDERVEIRGFGSFELRKYGSYTGINPRTKERIKVPPKKLPFFKPGKELRERVNRGKEKQE